MIDPTEFQHWPNVPTEQRPKRLYHRGIVGQWEPVLKERGWDPVDVRLLPNATDHDRAEALKAWLEGIRYGTIEAEKDLTRWLELEARVYGLHTGKGVSGTTTKNAFTYGVDNDGVVDFALGFGRDRAWASTIDEKLQNTRKRRGPRVKKTDAEEDGSE